MARVKIYGKLVASYKGHLLYKCMKTIKEIRARLTEELDDARKTWLLSQRESSYYEWEEIRILLSNHDNHIIRTIEENAKNQDDSGLFYDYKSLLEWINA